MNPEKQRIKIAEARGWKNHDHPDCMAKKIGWMMPESWIMRPDGVLVFRHDIPDYLNDLNAMNDAEKSKDMHFNQKWIESIVEVALNASGHTSDKTNGWDWVALVSRLSAAQRAEAFLRTLGLWEDAK